MLTNLILDPVYLIDTLEPIIKWVAIGLLIGTLITLLVVYLTDKNIFVNVAKKTLIALSLIALIVGIALLIMEISKKYDVAYLENNWVSLDVIPYVFIPVLTTLCFALILGVIYFILAKKDFAKLKLYRTVSTIIIALSIITTLVLMGIYYGKNVTDLKRDE